MEREDIWGTGDNMGRWEVKCVAYFLGHTKKYSEFLHT